MRNPVLEYMARLPTCGTSMRTLPTTVATPPTSMPAWLDIEQKLEWVGVTRPCLRVTQKNSPPGEMEALRVIVTSG